MKKITAAILLTGFLFYSCKKDEPKPAPPQNKPPDTTVSDFGTLEGLYKRVFKNKCNNGTCHNGSGGVDFSSADSALATLAFRPVSMADPDPVRNIVFRAVPRDTLMSALWQRINTEQDGWRKMPPGGTLTADERNEIKTWIMNGCPDKSGKPAQRPNKPVDIQWYFAKNDTGGDLNDANREDGWASPLMLPRNQKVRVMVRVADDIIITSLLKNNMAFLSSAPKDFTNARRILARNWEANRDFWVFDLHTSSLEEGKIMYLRFSSTDPITGEVSLKPAPDAPEWEVKHWAVVVK